MKIKEASEKTGLTKKTIRFYEAQRLIEVEKTWQNGRELHDYSEENVRQLQKIATLRRARFTVDEIRRMQETPGETADIFKDYRERLREEKRDLEEILSVAEAIAEEELSSADDLICRMESVTKELPLPIVDIHPRFRYLDQLEESYTRRKKLKMTEQEKKQHQIAAKNATMYAAFSVQNNTTGSVSSGKGGGFDMSNAQKVAAFNLLMNSKDE